MAALNKRHLSVVADDDNELASHVTPAALTFSDHCDGSQAGLLDTQASTVPPSYVDTQASTQVDTQASTQSGDWAAFDRDIRHSESALSQRPVSVQPTCSQSSDAPVPCTAESLLSQLEQPQPPLPRPLHHNSATLRPLAFGCHDTLNEKSVSAHSLGKMEHVCTKCQALHFEAEATSKVKVGKEFSHFTFSSCCGNGSISLPPIKEPPAELKQLFTVNNPQGRQFREHLREYNNAFTFASLKIDKTYMPVKKGICGLSISGRTSFFVGDLLPSTGANAADHAFSQLYLLDERIQLNQRSGKINIRSDTAKIIQDCIISCSPHVAKYRAAVSALGTGSTDTVTIRIHGNHVPEGVHARTYNSPTNDEIAAIIPGCAEAGVPGVGGECTRIDYNDIVVHSNSGGMPTIVRSCNKSTDPLHFVLPFPHGCFGFGEGLKTTGKAIAAGRAKVNDGMTVMKYYSFRLFTRLGQFSAIHHCKRLFQEYCVVQYCKEEAQRLNFIRHNQKKLRAELYQGVCDSVERGDSGPIGHRVVLPATFVGSQRYMSKCYQDSMAIVRAYGKPSLFITFTCNPKWDEIVSELFPGQDCVDRPDISSRVFELKLKSLLSEILDKGIFGSAVAHVSVVEYQKRGLPHAHILIILEKPIRPDDIDLVVSAELPNPVTQERLHSLVSAHMVHGPCGEANPECPCMVEGKCSKKFPKAFCDQSMCEVDKVVYRRRSPASGGFTSEKLLSNSTGRSAKIDNSVVVPYNPYLLMRYNAHINVEICNSVSSVKYLYKYVHKGADRVTFTAEANGTANAQRDSAQQGSSGRPDQHRRMQSIDPQQPPADIDELKNFQDGRWITSNNACARLLGFKVQLHKPSVLPLSLHVSGGQRCLLEDCDSDVKRRQYHERVAAAGFFSLYISISPSFSHS